MTPAYSTAPALPQSYMRGERAIDRLRATFLRDVGAGNNYFACILRDGVQLLCLEKVLRTIRDIVAFNRGRPVLRSLRTVSHSQLFSILLIERGAGAALLQRQSRGLPGSRTSLIAGEPGRLYKGCTMQEGLKRKRQIYRGVTQKS